MTFWRIFWPTLAAVSIPLMVKTLAELYTTYYIISAVKEMVAK